MGACSMDLFRARQPLVPFALVAFLLLAGCASSPHPAAGPSLSPGAPARSSDAPAAALANASAPAASQSSDLAWSGTNDPCFWGTPPKLPPFNAAYREGYRPEFKGALFDAAAVDRSTWGLAYNATIQFGQSDFFPTLLFWNTTVGPDGVTLASNAPFDGYENMAPHTSMEIGR